MTEDAVADTLPISSPGAMLAAARERSGLSVEDVARQLRLAPRQIAALEADDFASLPAAAFVRGFVRGYAKVVQADPEPVLEALRQVMPEQPAGSPQPRPVGTPLPAGAESASRRRAVVALLVLVLVPLALFEVFRQSRLPPPPAPATAPLPVRQVPPPVAAPEAAAPAPPAAAPEAQPAAALPAAPETPPSAGEAPAPAAAPVPAAAAPAQAAAGPAVLRLQFRGESWVEVRDRDGRRIFSQLNSPGTERTIEGNPPLALVIGNAAGVRLSYNGEPVDLSPHVQVNVARLTLE